MWRILLTLSIVVLPLAVPAPQKDNGDLGSLISSVFTPVTPTPAPAPADKNSGLNSLISEVFGTQSTTTPATVLGTENRPKQPDNCECVPYYQCREGNILEDGTGLIDIRSDFGDGINTQRIPRAFGPCTNYLDVCCKAPNKTTNDEIITPPPIVRKSCGERHPNGVGFRITGNTNNEAQFGEFPWMVAILKDEPIGENNVKMSVYQCGGSLIHRQAVLTAAHCVQGKNPTDLKIRAGEWDTQTRTEVFPHQDRNVQSVVVHEKFSSGSLHNDFAILILSEPVNFAENVDVVCLPERNMVFDGSRCYASGWGKDIFGKEGHYQVILKKVDLPIMPRDQCLDRLRSTRLGKYFELHESFICAGGEAGKDTCKGDGGSPLVCPSKSNPAIYMQAGIVAWGIGCGENATPGVYANVALARDWIDEQMAFNNLDNTVYQPAT